MCCCTVTEPLTDQPVERPGFVLPVHAHKIHGDARQHDDHAKAANHGFRVETEAQQHGPEDHVGDGDQHAYLQQKKLQLIN